MRAKFFKILSINYQIVFIFRTILLFWGTLTFFRLLFFSLYKPQGIEFVSLVLAFLVGIRFDFSVMTILLSLPLLLFWFPIRLRWYHFLLQNFVFFVLFFSVAVLIGDLFYYPFIGRHISTELRLFFDNKKDFLSMFLFQYYYALLLLPVAGYLLYFLYRKTVLAPANKYKQRFLSWVWLVPIVVLHIALSVIFVRGGFQKRSLNPSMAFRDDNLFLGNISLTGLYTGITAWYKADVIPHKQTYKEEHASALQALLYNSNFKQVSFKHSVYPFYQTRYKRKPPQKYNLILVVMESWSAADLPMLSRNNNKPRATPFFDSLAQKSLLFTNCYASGQRSIASLASVISSIPSQFGKVYVNSSYAGNRQLGLGSLFKQKGYRTYFAYAAEKTSLGFASYARIAGFENIITKESFAFDKVEEDGSWGVYDHHTFEKIHTLVSQEQKPFAAVIYTLHPHPPYHLPDDFSKPFSKDIPNADFFNALAYSDSALKKLFALAKNSWYKDNTVYVLVADHAFDQQEGVDRFHIPLLFYAPFLEAGQNDRLASQLDILPSLVDLFGLGGSYHATGTSLFDKAAHPRALWDMDDVMGYLQDEHVALFTANEAMGLYNYRTDPNLKKNLVSEKQELLEKLSEDFYLYQSAIAHSILDNAFMPIAK